ncbi:MAG: hypothetical protein K9L82_13210 [Chromatiaceae bacterium]|nr:hypothetical protein [Chromatiaceae bacterium]MCF7993543.1 hypothetical protein [Chromatiaceae bacterium]MCF8014473.1 hypothetical protein [Chromatiaceae bacterium]
MQLKSYAFWVAAQLLLTASALADAPSPQQIELRKPYSFTDANWPTIPRWTNLSPTIVCFPRLDDGYLMQHMPGWRNQEPGCWSHINQFPAVEKEMDKAFSWFGQAGLPLSKLGPWEERSGRKRLLISEKRDGYMAAYYCNGVGEDQQQRTYISFGWSKVLVEDRYGAEVFVELMAHELTHGLQNSLIYPQLNQVHENFCSWRGSKLAELKVKRSPVRFQYVAYDYGWLYEGMADYIGYRVQEDLYKGKTPLRPWHPQFMSYYGLKRYQLGFFGPSWRDTVDARTSPGYRNSSFFRYLEQRYLGRPKSVFEVFYNEEVPPPWSQPDAADWLEKTFRARIDDLPLAEVLANFFTDFASWPWDAKRVHPSVSKRRYLDIAFGVHAPSGRDKTPFGCRHLILSEDQGPVTVDVTPYPYGAVCLDLDIASTGELIPGDPHQIDNYQLTVEAEVKRLELADGLHLGRAVSMSQDAARSRKYLCYEQLDKLGPPLNEGVTCLVNRSGPTQASGPAATDILHQVTWKLEPTRSSAAGDREILIVTLAPTRTDGRVSDEFRRQYETGRGPDLIRLTLDVDNMAITESRRDPLNKQDADENTLRFVRITPSSSQFSGAVYGSLLFPDDLRADVFGQFHYDTWGKGLEKKSGFDFFETVRDVFAAEYGELHLSVEQAEKGAIDRRRSENRELDGFHVDILKGQAVEGILNGAFETEEGYYWVMVPEWGQTRKHLRWDDMQTGKIFEAQINPSAIHHYVTIRNTEGGAPWGQGRIKVIERSEAHQSITLRFEGEICPAEKTRIEFKNGVVQTTKCTEWHDLAAQGRFSFLAKYQKLHDKPVKAPMQKRYYARFARSAAIAAMREQAGSPDIDSGEPGSDSSSPPAPVPEGGGSSLTKECACQCNEIAALLERQESVGLTAGDLDCLNRCCPSYLQCGSANGLFRAQVQSICLF